MKYTVITLTNEGKFVTLCTEDQTYHISGAFQINSAMLNAFISADNEAFYDFDEKYALRLYRISDSSVAMHLTWIRDDGGNAYTQSCILPVSFFKRVISGKTVNAVVENDLRFYDPDVASEHLFSNCRMIKAYCF